MTSIDNNMRLYCKLSSQVQISNDNKAAVLELKVKASHIQGGTSGMEAKPVNILLG
jgi:hypothetical protein